MSIRSIIAGDGVGIYNNQRDIPTPTPPVVTHTSSAWVRPSDWPALPTLTSTSQEFAGLIAITNDANNYVAITLTTGSGTYSVNWGDGTTSTGVASGTAAQHQYNYSTYSGSVLTEGYKAAVVTATPDTGTLTGINLQVKYVIGSPFPALPAYITKWLDISLGSPNLTSLLISGLAPATYLNMLQQAQVWSVASSYPNVGANLFANCYNIQSVPTINLPSNYTTIASMFATCPGLKIAPTFPTSSVGYSASGIFQNCYSLETVPNLPGTPNNTSTLFFNCYSLKIAPFMNTAICTTMNSMFSGCSSLISVPTYNTSSVTDFTSMFSGCSSLKTVPLFNTSSVTLTTNMFLNCYSLISVPFFNLALVTSTATMFSGCYSLKSVPAFNLSACNAATSMFLNCYNLNSVGNFITTSALTDTSSMFQGCDSLQTAPTFNTSGVTNMSNMFQGAISLTTVPLYNTANVTTLANTFTSCSSLVTIPTFNTINNTSLANTFNSCNSFTTCPNIDTSNVINMYGTFVTCRSLTDVQFTNTSKVQQMYSMFNGASSFVQSTAWSSWNTSNVSNMALMFNACSSLITIPTFNTVNVANITSMFSASGVTDIPALNFNSLTAATTPFNGANSLARLQASNLKISINLTTTSMNQTALQEVFANTLLPNTTAQTITITSTPGADTPQAQTGTATANSNVITMSNTVGLSSGMIMTVGNGFGVSNRAATLYQANSQIVLGTGIAPANGMPISIATAPSGVTGYTQYQPYYVANSGVAAANAFQISTSNGGGALSFTGTGSLAGNVIFSTYISTVNANANIVLTNASNAAYSANSYTFRNLNVSQAVLKNWTITG